MAFRLQRGPGDPFGPQIKMINVLNLNQSVTRVRKAIDEKLSSFFLSKHTYVAAMNGQGTDLYFIGSSVPLGTS